MKRSSGILMHISSLPGNFGIGTLGKEAYKFVDFLKNSGQSYWQILPLGHTSYGDSPYQCFSAFAGNPYFIDFDLLEEENLLLKEDYINIDYGNDENKIDYGKIYYERKNILKKAYKNFLNKNQQLFTKFKEENYFWLEDYSLYMAIKEEFNLKSWQQWDEDIRIRKKYVLSYYKVKLKDEINYWAFVQFKFFEQWNNLKVYANKKGIKIIGDIPIYVAEDGSDIWANPKMFNLDENLKPKVVAGCPPDAFAKTGQLWGNPIYNWTYLESNAYKWWVLRIKESFKLYDVVRIDHFRGFESYWEVPYGDKTAEFGRWVKGPGIKLFNTIKDKLGNLNIIAEDLGFLTQEVIDFKDETGYPGMKVLQFAFGSYNSGYMPHNYEKNSVAYTGTHDNDTIKGWIDKERSSEIFKQAKEYLGLNEEEGYNFGFIRGVFSSVSDLVIIPLQDFLNLGTEARINIPSTLGGNWTWRVDRKLLTEELEKKIYKITELYGRL